MATKVVLSKTKMPTSADPQTHNDIIHFDLISNCSINEMDKISNTKELSELTEEEQSVIEQMKIILNKYSI